MTRQEVEQQIKAIWPEAEVGFEDSPGCLFIWIDSLGHDLTIEVSGNEPKVLTAALAAVKGLT